MMASTVRAMQFILAGAFATLAATAGPIQYTISAIATGTIGTTSFTDQLLTFTQVTDTTLIAPCSGYPCAPDVTLNTVTIATVGTYTLTGATYFFDNAINVVGITNAPGGAYLAVEDSSLATYTMLVDFGPTTYGMYLGSAVSGLATSGGSLTVTAFGTAAAGELATFEASTPTGSGPSTPEPGSLGLVLVAAIPLAAARLRRPRH